MITALSRISPAESTSLFGHAAMQSCPSSLALRNRLQLPPYDVTVHSLISNVCIFIFHSFLIYLFIFFFLLPFLFVSEPFRLIHIAISRARIIFRIPRAQSGNYLGCNGLALSDVVVFSIALVIRYYAMHDFKRHADILRGGRRKTKH